MDTKSSSITIADLCEQLKTANIIVNRAYQRTGKVWPAAAKSYLIDSILSGYPVPKIALYQKLDLAKRKTIREIVDGQQRTMTIQEFYNDKIRITGKSRFFGKTFSQLDEVDQRSFLEYALSVDVFVGASENDIRQVFRRMNSYTVPLNPEEKRHAVFQGAFKWFIVELVERYTEPLKRMGVLTESAISRMQDAKLFSEIIYSLLHGIDNSQDAKLDKLYSDNDEGFSQEADVAKKIDFAMKVLIGFPELHCSDMMKAYNFYSLFIAVIHCCFNEPALATVASISNTVSTISPDAKNKLIDLNEALVSGGPRFESQRRYMLATEKATNRKIQREDRFKYLVELILGN